MMRVAASTPATMVVGEAEQAHDRSTRSWTGHVGDEGVVMAERERDVRE